MKSNILILLFALVIMGCGNQKGKEVSSDSSSENKLETSIEETNYGMAPEFTLPSLSGDTISLKDYRGQIVVVHIATTWCPFCNAEAPYLENLYQDYKDNNVEVLLVDVKEPQPLVRKLMKEKHGLNFPILLDTDGQMAASYAPDGVLPDLARDEVMLASNLIIDKNGEIQFMSLLDSKNFDAELIQLKSRLDELL